MTIKLDCDIFISGGGLAGLTLALALVKTGRSVIVCSPASKTDKRTTALLNDSVEYLKSLNVWEPLSRHAFPLKTMRLVDGTKRLFRIQQTDFRASEIGLEAFGYNIRNRDMISILQEMLHKESNVDLIDGHVIAVETNENDTTSVSVASETDAHRAFTASFVVGADGKNSVIRNHFGHGERSWSYPQTALVVDFSHEYSSGFASTEFHTETGPFTVVPQTDKIAGLVWLEKPEVAEALKTLPNETLELKIEEKMQSCLGKINILEPAQTFAISGMTAKCLGDRHHALIGEAAHVFPPIGAQGFNLGIRDIKELVSVFENKAFMDNVGQHYHSQRLKDINSRTTGVDMLNRSLLSGFLPVQIARSTGMLALAKIAPLRKKVMKMGVSPVFHG